jgi:hypothetical protein
MQKPVYLSVFFSQSSFELSVLRLELAQLTLRLPICACLPMEALQHLCELGLHKFSLFGTAQEITCICLGFYGCSCRILDNWKRYRNNRGRRNRNEPSQPLDIC